MRTINTQDIVPVIEKLCQQACYELNDNVMNAFQEALTKEESPIGKDCLSIIIKNSKFAKEH